MGRGLEKCKSMRDLALIIIFTMPTVNLSPTRLKSSRKADKRTTCRTYFVASFFFFFFIYIYIWSKCYIFSPEKPEEERKPTMSASELLKAHEKELKRTKSSSTGTLGAPMLGRGLAPGSDLFFDGSPKFGKRKLNDTERAKVNMN